VTDPDSRNLKTTRGWVQGDNAQAAVTAEHIVVAAEISIGSLDTANLHPMVETARRELEAAGVTEARGRARRRRLLEERRDRSDRRTRHHARRPRRRQAQTTAAGRRGRLYDFARRVLATDRGKSSTSNARAPPSQSSARLS
jgi:hypothetical protein